ncbi:MAG: QsdR family transcriptional regulator [Actinomycetota bacterium]
MRSDKIKGLETPPRGRIITYEAALAEARRAFLAGGGLDVATLARKLSVSRATLYRVIHSRDRLLGDVIWSFGERTLSDAIAQTHGKGVERLVETARVFNAAVVSFKPLRSFIRDEPHAGFRVLITASGGVHQRFVESWKNLFLEAERAGEIVLPMEVDQLAYVFVRIGESMLYSDLLGDREPDIEVAATAQRALLKQP